MLATAISMDMSISLGTMIHLVVLIGSIIGVWMRIEKRMTIVEERLLGQEKTLQAQDKVLSAMNAKIDSMMLKVRR